MELQAGDLVLFSAPLRDIGGRRLTYVEILRHIRKFSAVPIYGYWDFDLGNGIVGGKLLQAKAIGQQAAKIGLRILGGENAADIPVEISSPQAYMFDDHELIRFNIPHEYLPAASIIINQPELQYALKRVMSGQGSAPWHYSHASVSSWAGSFSSAI